MSLSSTSGALSWGEHETWYQVWSSDAHPTNPDAAPVLVLHGGPGMTHDYLRGLRALADAGRDVILYDQVGNGRSSRHPDRAGDGAYWTPELFLEELRRLVDHLQVAEAHHLVGQSWGGMLGIEWAIQRPSGLLSLVLADSPSSMTTWSEELNRLREAMPEPVRLVLDSHEKAGTTDSPEYAAATRTFYERHLCRLRPWPQDMETTYRAALEDPTVYGTMIGPSEVHVTGSLATWDRDADLHRIAVPTLVLNGEFDEATDHVVAACARHVPDVERATIAGASHTPHLEREDEFLRLVGAFLARHDHAPRGEQR